MSKRLVWLIYGAMSGTLAAACMTVIRMAARRGRDRKDHSPGRGGVAGASRGAGPERPPGPPSSGGPGATPLLWRDAGRGVRPHHRTSLAPRGGPRPHLRGRDVGDRLVRAAAVVAGEAGGLAQAPVGERSGRAGAPGVASPRRSSRSSSRRNPTAVRRPIPVAGRHASAERDRFASRAEPKETAVVVGEEIGRAVVDGPRAGEIGVAPPAAANRDRRHARPRRAASTS